MKILFDILFDILDLIDEYENSTDSEKSAINFLIKLHLWEIYLEGTFHVNTISNKSGEITISSERLPMVFYVKKMKQIIKYFNLPKNGASVSIPVIFKLIEKNQKNCEKNEETFIIGEKIIDENGINQEED